MLLLLHLLLICLLLMLTLTFLWLSFSATRQLSTVDRDFVLSNEADKCTVLKRALHLFTKGEKVCCV